MKKNSLVIIIVLTLQSNFLSAQESLLFGGSKHRIGYVSGYGCQNQLGLDVKYDYQIIFFQFQYYYSFLRRKTWGLDILVQPQYNITKYKQLDNDTYEVNGFELGTNIGILIRKNILNDFLSFYALLSLGPHYVSGTPQRQASGFVFSDNLFVGMNIHLLKNMNLDIRPGFRHISNAGLVDQNAGVNNIVLSGGILINL
jgi:hypothetical protein